MKDLLFMKPYCREVIWGGQRLKEIYGYETSGCHTGEAWVVSANENGQSVVDRGEYKGRTLKELWDSHRELFGNLPGEEFPLLVKLIDAREDLSIQVHPDDGYARLHEAGARGKNECWYILDCPQEADIIIGHRAKSRGELARNEKLKGEIRRLEQAARRTAAWSDKVERSKYGGENAGLKVDRGFVGHRSAKLMKRAKGLESRQEEAIREKSALLRDVERADELKLFPLTYPGGRLLEGRELAAAYGGRSTGRPVTFTLEPGERLCLEGGNGTGKTSLLRLALGEELPHTGTLRRASGLLISYVPQKSDHLSGSLPDWAEGQGVDRTQLFTILRKLDFGRELFERDMAQYSAGQQKKVLLAASLCRRAHLYVWDEPLNYIDLFSRMQLEELILRYRPTMLLVEHDRAFRERVGTASLTL